MSADVTCDGRPFQKLSPDSGKARFGKRRLLTVERMNGGSKLVGESRPELDSMLREILQGKMEGRKARGRSRLMLLE